MKTLKTLLAYTTLLFVTSTTHAALYDRGNGLIYDSVQNLTWLQDFNLVTNAAVHINPDVYIGGYMHWEQAKAYVEDFEYGGYSDWRLPSCANSLGYCSEGYHTAYPAEPSKFSELAYLFRVELNNSPLRLSNNLTFMDGQSGRTVSFTNFTFYDWYWENEKPENALYSGWWFKPEGAYPDGLVDTTSWNSVNGRDNVALAYAVRDGDVALLNNVPLPATAWLFGSSLIGFGLAARRTVK